MSPFSILLELMVIEVMVITGAISRAKLPVKMSSPITIKPISNFLQTGCPSCHSTNSVKAQKGKTPPNIFVEKHLGLLDNLVALDEV